MKAPTPLEALLKERVALAVGGELRAIEDAIAAEIASSVPLVAEMGEFIAGAGGKRLRPILLLIAARLAGYQGPRAVRMGCVVELLHTATLIHDDVVDQAPLRRGRPSANARWGDDASILVGDHLYSKSFALMVGDGDPRVLDTLARATVSMTEAEVFQLERKRSGTTSEADYLRIITQKTASFMSACCRIGGMLGGAEPEQVDRLTRYGLDIGIAFQISDDSLDFVADQARLGKAVGADLKEGKRTLPLIATLDRAEPAERERIQALLKSHALDPAEIEEIRRLVVKYEGIEYALARAHAYAQSAKGARGWLPWLMIALVITFLAVGAGVIDKLVNINTLPGCNDKRTSDTLSNLNKPNQVNAAAYNFIKETAKSGTEVRCTANLALRSGGTLQYDDRIDKDGSGIKMEITETRK